MPVTPDPNWIVGKYALMNVRASISEGSTIIEPTKWRIPFQWQGYHYQNHDDQPFMLLLNSSGGFVEGDVSHFHATLEPGTRCLFTTTASSKFYKCPEGNTSREIVDIIADEGSLVELLPDEAIPFANSRVHRINRIGLKKSSRLFATDMISAGRIHYGDGEIFDFYNLVSEFEISIEGKIIALDRIVAINPDEVAAMSRLWEGYLHMATAFAYAPNLPAKIEDEIYDYSKEFSGCKTGVSRIGNFLTVRLLARETWEAHEGDCRCGQCIAY